MIKINWKKNNSGKYDFTVVQDDKVLFKKEYVADKKYETAWIDQAHLFGAYIQFLQDKVDKEIEKNPNFHWKSFNEFKKFAGAKTQNEFFEHQDEYLPDNK